MSSSSSVYLIRFSEASSNPLHPLGATLRQFIYDHLQTAIRDPSVSSIVLMGSDKNFSAGADLQELDSVIGDAFSTTALSLLDVIALLDSCPKPTVAMISGACLGGGLELALACNFRVCLPSATLGLPGM
jgi:3-hydroxyacyl-CoA dehydrogenase